MVSKSRVLQALIQVASDRTTSHHVTAVDRSSVNAFYPSLYTARVLGVKVWGVWGSERTR